MPYLFSSFIFMFEIGKEVIMYAREIRKSDYEKVIEGISKNSVFDPFLRIYLIQINLNGINYALKASIDSRGRFVVLGVIQYTYDKKLNCHSFIEVRKKSLIVAMAEILLYQYVH